MFDLDNKIALVTGASSGIGAGIAKMLAKAGADVALNYNSNKAGAMEVASHIESLGRKALAIKANVRSETQVNQMFDTLMDQFGRLDILVNNAGTNGPEEFPDISLERWNEVIETNLTSGFLCSKAAMAIMTKQNYGRIIIHASMTGQRGAQYGQVHYAASKGGLLAFARTLARCAAPYNITVNALAPAPIDTGMRSKVHDEKKRAELAVLMPMGVGKVEDVAAAVVYLASDEASYITGATIDITGGMYMR
jgi:3-oxoacyl-[acyl-carrier protein] reductase